MSTSPHIAVSGSLRPDFPQQDWDRAPWNRWTFQHVAEILPTAPVQHDPHNVIALQRDLQPLGSILFSDEGHTVRINDWLESSFTDGFIVIKNNKIIAEHYLNGMTPSTLHLAQSVSKSVTATAFGILSTRGLVDPERLIIDYLPELADTAYATARLRHILDMTSGVRFDENYTDPYSDAGRIDVASGWKQPTLPGKWPSSMHELILDLKTITRPHGAQFEYRSIETDVLAWVMERVTGKGLPEIVSDEIWQKIGAEHDGCFTVDGTGFALGDGGFNATLRDFARFGLLWANQGMVGNQQILPRTWIEATRQGDSSLFHSPYTDVLPNGAYRNQFWLTKGHGGVLLCRGVFGQLIYIDVEQSFVAVKLSTWPEFTSPTRLKTALNAISALAASIG